MTSQAERIKAFKLAQHARLQKQDDEEHWISSEELCTEGSSDEETHMTISGHRKLKRNNKPQKRGISPLAQPSKKDEPASSDSHDSNYLLPEIPIPHNLAEAKVESKANTSFDDDSSRNSSKDLSDTNSEESLDVSEIETMIQWRPKRGSIKLPECPEGIPTVEITSIDNFHKTEEHSLFEINALLAEMHLTVRNLKLQKNYKSELFPDVDENEEIRVRPYSNFEKNAKICRLLDDVNQLDDLISEKSFILEKVTEERKIVQDEMCNMIISDSSLIGKNLQSFLELCHFEAASSQDVEEVIQTNPKPKDQKQKSEKPINKGNYFINRNIQLAKQYSMAQCSLTDEEKIQLESLLSDISDSEEYTMASSLNKSISSKKQKTSKDVDKKAKPKKNKKEGDEVKRNYFKLDNEETSLMTNLDTQLNEILESYKKQEVVDIHDEFDSTDGDILENADKSGKFWKHDQIRKRLERIQRNLNQMAAKDDEDQKKLEEIRKTDDTDSDN